MSELKAILGMIENVDIDDTDALDEIDARVWCLINGYKFKRILKNKYPKRQPNRFSYYCDGDIGYKINARSGSNYTRSRDALKAIRPEGWQVSICEPSTRNDATCELIRVKNGVDKDGYITQEEHYVSSPTLQNKGLTEELAELHAIIQAVEWERNNE